MKQIKMKWRETSPAEREQIAKAQRPHEIYAAIKIAAVDWDAVDAKGDAIKFAQDHFETTISLTEAKRLLSELVGSFKPQLKPEKP